VRRTRKFKKRTRRISARRILCAHVYEVTRYYYDANCVISIYYYIRFNDLKFIFTGVFSPYRNSLKSKLLFFSPSAFYEYVQIKVFGKLLGLVKLISSNKLDTNYSLKKYTYVYEKKNCILRIHTYVYIQTHGTCSKSTSTKFLIRNGKIWLTKNETNVTWQLNSVHLNSLKPVTNNGSKPWFQSKKTITAPVFCILHIEVLSREGVGQLC